MKISDLYKKSSTELVLNLIELRKFQFKLRMQKSMGQLVKTHLLKENRKSIARVKTVMFQKLGK